MFPDHIFELEDAYFWLDEQLNLVPANYVVPEPTPLELLLDAADNPSGLRLHKVGFHFISLGTVLSVNFLVGPDLEPLKYRFDYRFDGEPQEIWRHDKQRGHEDEDGTDRHYHYTDAEGIQRRLPVRAPMGLLDLMSGAKPD